MANSGLIRQWSAKFSRNERTLHNIVAVLPFQTPILIIYRKCMVAEKSTYSRDSAFIYSFTLILCKVKNVRIAAFTRTALCYSFSFKCKINAWELPRAEGISDLI